MIKPLNALLLTCAIALGGCASKEPLLNLSYSINHQEDANTLRLTNKPGPNEGLLYLKVNSEIQNNILILVNLDTGKKYRSDKLVGRYHRFITKLPAGKYRWSSIKLNGGYFSPKDNTTPQFEILPGKLNYPGDMDIIIYSRADTSASIGYVDRENTIAPVLLELDDYEFHYAKLSETPEEE